MHFLQLWHFTDKETTRELRQTCIKNYGRQPVIVVGVLHRFLALPENQDILQSYDSAPGPPPSPPVSKLSLFLSLPECHRSSRLKVEGGRGWAWSKIIRPREAWRSENYSVFSAHHHHIIPTPFTNLAKHKTNWKQNETRFEAVENPNYS
jgi:hypothetical protein